MLYNWWFFIAIFYLGLYLFQLYLNRKLRKKFNLLEKNYNELEEINLLKDKNAALDKEIIELLKKDNDLLRKAGVLFKSVTYGN